MKILRVDQVVNKIGLSKSAIYDRLNIESKRYDHSFPRPLHLGEGKNSTIGFIEAEVEDWIFKQADKRSA